MDIPSDIVPRFYSEAEKVIETIIEQNDNVLIHYVGNMDEPFANALTARLEKIIGDSNIENSIRKRFFSVFIEIIQNIRIHGIKDFENHIHAGLIVYRIDDQLHADFFNIVSEKQANFLEHRYAEINSLPKEDLKKRYMDIMLHGELSLKGGAGLGIITVVLKSRNPSLIQIHELKDHFKVFQSHIKLSSTK